MYIYFCFCSSRIQYHNSGHFALSNEGFFLLSLIGNLITELIRNRVGVRITMSVLTGNSYHLQSKEVFKLWNT